MDGLAHWDEVPTFDGDVPPVRSHWRNLGAAARSRNVGVQLIDVEPGWQSTPPHAHGRSEEIFYIVRGDGFLWDGGRVCEVRAGDCIVHHAGGRPHTLVAGADGLSALAFGTRHGVEHALHSRSDTVTTFGFRGVTHEQHPWQLESGRDVVDVSEPGERPRTVVATEDVEAERWDRAGVHRTVRFLGDAVGARHSGLSHFEVDGGGLANIPHCHSADEELFVVLEGEGALTLSNAANETVDEAPLRAGSVVARPAGSRLSHAIRGAGDGLRMVGYSDTHPYDACFYPRSQKVALGGLGVRFRITNLDYFDGEE